MTMSLNLFGNRMKTIRLTRNKFALVDDQDFNWLNEFNWYAHKGKSPGLWYVSRGVNKPKRTTISMHRLILDVPQGVDIDHIDRNGLNNQRNNLRVATKIQNAGNQRKIVGASSRYKGVTWHKRDNRWQAQLQTKKRMLFLGTFTIEQEAALAYDEAAMKYFGAYAYTNKMLELDRSNIECHI